MMSPIKAVEILLVEDNAADILLVKHALKSADISNNLNIATDGEMALNILSETKEQDLPDLILLDLNLPKIEGKEVLRKIKENKNLKNVPVIIMSGSIAEKDKQESLDLEAASYIVKPLNLEKLVEISKAVPNFSICLIKT